MQSFYRINHMFTAHTICLMMLAQDRFKRGVLFKILPMNKASRQRYWNEKQISVLELRLYGHYSALHILTKRNANTLLNVLKTTTRNIMRKLKLILKHPYTIGLLTLPILYVIWQMLVYSMGEALVL